MKRFATVLLLISVLFLSACQNATNRQLQDAERLVTTNPDSALAVLDSIPQEGLTSEGDLALWNMLRTWALYRNYEKVIPIEPLDQAFEYFTREQPCTSLDSVRVAQAYYLRSVVRQDQKIGENQEWAQDMYEAALAVEGSSNHTLAAMIFQRNASMHYDIRDYDEAISWNKKYIREAHLAENYGEEVTAYINLSLSLYEKDRDGDAIPTIRKAIALARQHNMLTEEGKCYGDLSVFFSHSGQLDSALVYALKAKDIDEKQYKSGQRREQVRYIHVAEAYRRLGIADSAIIYAKKDIDNPSIITRRNAAQMLYMIYNEVVHDYQLSLKWMQMQKAIEDTIHIEQEGQQMNTNKTVVNEKKAKEAATRQVHRTQYWIHIIVVLAVLSIVGIVVFNRRRYHAMLKKQEERFNEMLAQQNAKLAEIRAAKQEAQARAEEQNVASTEPAADAVGTQVASSEGTTAAPSAQPHVATDTPAVEEAKAEAAVVMPVVERVTLTGTTKESLSVRVDDLLYLASEGNYINVAYIHADGLVKQKMLRQTMTAIENMLNDCPNVVRCHRAFCVNLHHVTKAHRSSSGLTLTLDATDFLVPVSKTYISTIMRSVGHE